jgi:subtilisin
MTKSFIDLIAESVARLLLSGAAPLNPADSAPAAAESTGSPAPIEAAADDEIPDSGAANGPGVYRLANHEVQSIHSVAPKQWAVQQYGIRDVWAKYGVRGEGSRVAVIDTGVNVGHPDLRHVIAHDMTGHGVADKQGHGSHCCGIVGAAESGGVFGVAPQCDLHSFRVFDDAGYCDCAWIVRALREIMEGKHGRFDVVSMSLGSETPSEEMRMVLLEMSARGHLIVVAAGNDGSHRAAPGRLFGTIGYPAGFLSTIAVGSTDRRRERSAFSSTGNKMVLTGPGQDITNCWSGPELYATISGTSMACPFVAGCLALLVSHARVAGLPAPTTETVTYSIAASSVDIDSPGYDFNTGFGDIDPARLIDAYEKFSRAPAALE